MNKTIRMISMLVALSAVNASAQAYTIVDYGTNNTSVDFAGNGNNVSILVPTGREVIAYGDHGFLDARGQSGVRQTQIGVIDSSCINATYSSPVTDDTGFAAIDTAGDETIKTYVTCFYGWGGGENAPTSGETRSAWLNSMVTEDLLGNNLVGGSVGGFTLDFASINCTDFSLDGLYIEAGFAVPTASPHTIENAMRAAVWQDGALLGYFDASNTSVIASDVRVASNNTFNMQDMFVDFGSILQNADVSGSAINVDYFAIVNMRGTSNVAEPIFVDDPALFGAGCVNCVPEPTSVTLLALGSLSLIVRRKR